MKKINLLLAGIITIGSLSVSAQRSNVSASSLVAKAHQQEQAFSQSNIIISEVASRSLKSRLSSSLSEFGTFKLSQEKLRTEKQVPADFIRLSMPLPDGTSAQLELVKVNITTPDFTVTTPNGIETIETGQHYRGIINGDANSLAAISIFDNEISGTLSFPEKGDYTIGLMQSPNERANGTHIIYNTKLLQNKLPNWGCATKDDHVIPYSAKQLSNSPNSAVTKYVRLYYETEYDMYTTLGTTTAVSNFMLGLQNQVGTLYSNDGVNTMISGLYIWTNEDPYTGENTYENLMQFQATRLSFNGDLAQLLTFRYIGGGMAAGFSGLCSANVTDKLSTSQLDYTYENVPTYSWNINVVTHEFGHLFGSRHTHACVWNGNNTAIDGCSGYTEGGCALPGIPTGGGTIMSYCHLQSVGINFSLGFGSQPASVIRSSVANAPCLTGNCQLTSATSWINCYAQVACGWTTFNTFPRKMGDINGDGKADIIGFGNAGVYYSLSTGSGFGTPVFALPNFGATTEAGGWSSFDAYPREVADVNGDGKADIIGFGASGVLVSYSTGAGFTAPVFLLAYYATGAGGWSSFNTYPRRMGDVNGDGKADIIGFAKGGVFVSYSTGTGFTAASLLLANYGTSVGGWSSFDTYPRSVADVNGDGKADIVGFASSGVFVAHSTGTGFTAPLLMLANYGTSVGGWSSFDTYPREVADVNGDGKADIVGFASSGVLVSYSTGSGFTSPVFLMANFGTAAGRWTNYNSYPRVLADVDGNGKKDIVGFGIGGAYVSLSNCNANGVSLTAPVNAADIIDTKAVHDFVGNDLNGNLNITYSQETGNLNTISSIENESRNSIVVYPNPAKENVTFSGLNHQGRFEIANVLGQVILQKIITTESATVNLSEMKAGIYYIQFYNNEGARVESKKLIIEK